MKQASRKTGRGMLVFSLASLTGMVSIDYLLGAKAEFLNAWSVLQRLFGQPADAGTSLVAMKLGSQGELLVVLGVNLFIGLCLHASWQWLRAHQRQNPPS